MATTTTTRLIGDSVPMMINGVSQQSEMIRLPTQVEEQINCVSSIVQGVSKRPPTEFLKQLDVSKDWSNAKVHLIQRDENEQYIVVLESSHVRVFSLDGGEHAVEGSRPCYLDLNSDSNTHTTPLEAFRLFTIADTTFVVNRNKVVAMDSSSASSSNKPYRALVWVKSVKSGKAHRVTVIAPDQGLNISVSYKPHNEALMNLTEVSQQLASKLKDAFISEGVEADWKVGSYTSILYLESTASDFSISVSNEWSDLYISSIKDSVAGAGELPSRGFPGMKVKVAADAKEGSPGFWVKFVGDYEEVEAIDENGFNIIEFDASALSEADKVQVGDHTLLYRDSVGNSFQSERELVQYKAGSFIVGTVTTGTPNVIAAKLIDNKFYWIDPLLSSDGLPTGEIQLSDSPALGVGNAGTQDDPGTAITWSAVDDTAYTEVAGITQDTATFGDGAGSNPAITNWTVSSGIVTLTLGNREVPAGSPANHDWIAGDEILIEGTSSAIPVIGTLDRTYEIISVAATTVTIDVSNPSFTTAFDAAYVTNSVVSGYVSSYKKASFVRARVMYGKWVETVGPSSSSDEILTAMDSETMPHFLIRSNETQVMSDGVSRYKFFFMDGSGSNLNSDKFPLHYWRERTVGDNISSPLPSFIDHKINDVFEWRQSLGFASQQNFILSERSQHFNFWPITVATSVDDARIDVSASGNDMSNFHSIKVFQDELIGFTNEGQFTLSAGSGPLTPETVSLTQSTRYESSEIGQPLDVGTALAFPTSRGGFSSISEYFVREDQLAYVNDSTRHVDRYIEGNVTQMSVSSISDSLVVLTDVDKHILYFYQWYWRGNEKVQSSWSKWSFNMDVISAHFVKDILYLIMQEKSGTKNPELCKIILTPGDTDEEGTYKTSLDRRKIFESHSSSTINLPYTIEEGTVRVVTDTGKLLPIGSTDSTSITLVDAPDSENLYVGEEYNSQVELTRPVVKSRYKENVDLRSRLQIQDYILHHEDTGYLRVEVYPRKNLSQSYQYEMDNLLGGTIIDDPSISSGSFRIPVRSNSRDMRLIIHNDSHFPHHIISAEWSATYSPKVYRS